MSSRSVIPFGPQHPVLPEPIHLDLVLEDEKVVEAVPSIGFVHRGLESLVTKKDFKEMVYVAERICGICSFGHGFGYCDAVEHIMDIQVTERANYLRTILFELSRMHSHILWLGLMADAFGFENLFMDTWRIREKVLDMLEAATGGRVIFSILDVGGLRKDIPDDMLKGFLPVLKDIEKELAVDIRTFLNDSAVKSRLCGVGILSAEEVENRETAESSDMRHMTILILISLPAPTAIHTAVPMSGPMRYCRVSGSFVRQWRRSLQVR